MTTLGYKHTEETKEKIRQAHLGKVLTEEHKRKISESGKGKTHSEETRRKIGKAHKGAKNHFWKGGISTQDRLLRESVDAKIWRENVFKRDNYTCKDKNCGVRGTYLEAHHIKPWRSHPEERFNVDNGITYCLPCHRLNDDRRR